MIRWDDNLWLFTPEEYSQLPDGFELGCIDGSRAIKGKDEVDMDTRGGHLAYGVQDPLNHCDAELFTKFKLVNG